MESLPALSELLHGRWVSLQSGPVKISKFLSSSRQQQQQVGQQSTKQESVLPVGETINQLRLVRGARKDIAPT